MIIRTVKLNLAQGLHIRVCSKVVAIVGNTGPRVCIKYGNKSADASSMFDLIQLAVLPGSELVLEGDGDGVESILDAIEQLFSHTTESEA